MRKNRLLSLLLAAVMTAAAALSLASCSSDNDNNGNSNDPSQQYNVAGTWMAEYEVMGTVGGSQMEYSRLRTACTFNNDGMGTWYKFMLDEGSNEPIALDGGAEHGDYTYSVAAATSAGTVATAMIAYVGSETGDATYNHGLAIALSNEANEMSLSAARDICEKKAKYAGAKWCVPNNEQWLQMFSTNGGDIESIVGLNEALTAACGTGIPDGFYWSSTVVSNYNVGLMLFDDGYVTIAHAKKTYWGFLCRACLVF